MATRHLGVVIRRSPEDVYAYARDPGHLPEWATGLAGGPVETSADGLVTDSPMGRVTVRFAPRNDLGVLDHDVVLPSGEVVHNPLRVLPHPDGAEVVFTLRQLDATEEELERDAVLVAADLDRLRALLEAESAVSGGDQGRRLPRRK